MLGLLGHDLAAGGLDITLRKAVDLVIVADLPAEEQAGEHGDVGVLGVVEDGAVLVARRACV